MFVKNCPNRRITDINHNYNSLQHGQHDYILFFTNDEVIGSSFWFISHFTVLENNVKWDDDDYRISEHKFELTSYIYF